MSYTKEQRFQISMYMKLYNDEDMRNLIIDWESEAWILTKARENWFVTLQEDWIIKVLKWETTMDEIHRVL